MPDLAILRLGGLTAQREIIREGVELLRFVGKKVLHIFSACYPNLNFVNEQVLLHVFLTVLVISNLK